MSGGNQGFCPVIAPCMDCQKRWTKCHSECEEFLAFRIELEAYRAMQRKERGLDFVTDAIRKKISAIYQNRTKVSLDQ